jgi:hypothetical protein
MVAPIVAMMVYPPRATFSFTGLHSLRFSELNLSGYTSRRLLGTVLGHNGFYHLTHEDGDEILSCFIRTISPYSTDTTSSSLSERTYILSNSEYFPSSCS